MTRDDQQNTVSANSPHGSRPSRRLAEFNGQRMAVVMRRPSGRVVLRGTAEFVRDDTVGNALSIRLDEPEPGHPVVVIAERSWRGRIVPDFHHGCKFCLVLDQA